MAHALPILDLYVLSLVDRGLGSMYEFQKIGGLSLGASTPAIKRLLKSKLLTQQSPQKLGKRVRFQFQLTIAGRKHAKEGWKNWIVDSSFPSDLDAQLRLFDMALANGMPLKESVALLARAADAKAQRPRMLLDGALAAPGNSFVYAKLRDQCDSHRLKAEIQALREIAAGIQVSAGATSSSPRVRRQGRKGRP